MRNRILAFVLTVCMIAGTVFSVPMTLYAKPNDSSNRAVMFLTNLNFMELDEYTGEFWDDSLVKRFEMAQILCRLLNYDVKTDNVKKFTDVSEQDRAYVETVVRNGCMSGYGDGKFGPNDYVTCGQVVKIFVDLIGGKAYAEIQGGFPKGYTLAAKRFDIIRSMNIVPEQTARRIDVAQIIYDALHTDMVQLVGVSSDGNADYQVRSGETLLSEILDIEIIEGKITAIDTTSLNRANGGTGEDAVIIEGLKVLDPNRFADEYLGSSVKAYAKVNKDKNTYTLIYVEEKASNEIVEIWGDSITSATKKLIKYSDGERAREKKFSAITDMIYNGKAVAFDESRLKKLSTVNIKMTDNNDDGTIDLVNITEYKDMVVERTVIEDEMIYFKYGEAPLSLKENYVRIFLDGEEADLATLSEGTVVSVAVSEGEGTGKAIKILGCTDSAYGSIDSLRKRGSVQYAVISGKEYAISSAAKALQAGNHIPEIKAGVGGQFYLNTNGEIVYFTSGSTAGDVGYLVAMDFDNDAFKSEALFKIYTDKGKMEIFSANDKIIVNGNSIKVSSLPSSQVWTELSTEVAGKQLVKYTAEDGVIKKITYCLNTPSYDPNEFSLDVKESLYVRKQNVLGYTYSVDSSTKVFYVPADGSAEIEKYKILSGTYFRRDKTYDVSLYDLNSQGRVSYAIVRSNGSVLTVDNSFMFVTDVLKGMNGDGDIVNIIAGYNTAGNLVEIKSMPGEVLVDSADSTRTVEKGDLIQYALNALNGIEELKVVHKLTDTSHNGIGTVHNGDRLTSFGYAANVSSSGFLVTETKPTGVISPLDAKAVIPVGGTVILYKKDTEYIAKVSFGDILPGDEIFTLGNASNSTMITIIYR